LSSPLFLKLVINCSKEKTGHESDKMIEHETQLTEDFRLAMRQLASTVSIITTKAGTDQRGLTATAVCSLSLTPPSMLVCVNRLSLVHKTMLAAGCFCVNILAETQAEIATRFAGKSGAVDEDRFAPYHWTQLATAAPALDGAVANLDCITASVSHTQSHSIFIGHVQSIRCNPDLSPLLHHDRHFFSLTNGQVL